jgi:hypothetical protein
VELAFRSHIDDQSAWRSDGYRVRREGALLRLEPRCQLQLLLLAATSVSVVRTWNCDGLKVDAEEADELTRMGC